MKNVLKISLLVFVLCFGLTSCTAEDISNDDVNETVATNRHKKDLNPPIE